MIHLAVRRSLTISLLLLAFGCGSDPRPEPADLVLVRGKLVTMDDAVPSAEALAVGGDRIIAVGGNAEVELYVGPATRIIDLEGQLAVPGLIEGHGHYFRLGESLMRLALAEAKTWDEIVDQVARAAEAAEPGEWIVGRGWHQDKWQARPQPSVEGLPTHHALSAVSPQNPVLLEHASGHGTFVNARAMELAGISEETSDPAGGEIVRDAYGQPIGMLRETAADAVSAAFEAHRAQRSAEAIEAEMRTQVRLAARNAIENGITSFHDMGSTFAELDLLEIMAEEGNLDVRLYMAIEEPAAALEGRLSDYRRVDDGYLTIRTIGEKVLDGALGTHGGWLLEPYTDLPRSAGFNVTPIEDIRRSAELAIQHDYQMAIQGIGDKAARILFDLYEEIFAANPDRSDLRWRIEHAQVIHPDDLSRFAELGIIPGIQGIFACSDGPWVIDRLGEERARERGYVFRSMIESGAVVMNGTDPPVENIDPIASFHCSVTRELPDGSLFFPEQSMTREQALRAYTLNNAYAAFEEDIKGSLTPGKLADVTVLTRDIMTLPDDEIRSTEIAYTIIGGEVKYERQPSARSDDPVAEQ